jgi:hypothetical protein
VPSAAIGGNAGRAVPSVWATGHAARERRAMRYNRRVTTTRLEILGHWFRADAPSSLPLPQRLVSGLGADERAAVLAYLRGGTAIVTYPEASFCRFACGETAMGTRDLTDGRWVWPEGLAHYVERHDVRLPPPFVAHALACDGVVAPFRAPKPRFGLYDASAWQRWAESEGACLDLTGFELPDDEVRDRIAAELGGVDYDYVLLCNGRTREVVLDVGGGALEVRQLRRGGAAARRLAGWHEWPIAGAGTQLRRQDARPSPAERHPGRPRPGLSLDEFRAAFGRTARTEPPTLPEPPAS